ncbi:uncharacterized protein LOC114256216 isoform X2 [Camellia sinensis]|uniref:uncharacterized protein LOC114256216 isoform X2 n=1 Tax=Camellia sinensis TaxID=4442 RepID=UPI0010366EAF|nr:uncharacterized protein LOC114256216 isoform X2 [Camellia sinensis]
MPVQKRLLEFILAAFHRSSDFVALLKRLSNPLTGYMSSFPFVFWTLTIIPLLKYALIVLRADYAGEGMPKWVCFQMIKIPMTLCALRSKPLPISRWNQGLEGPLKNIKVVTI